MKKYENQSMLDGDKIPFRSYSPYINCSLP